MTDEMRDGGGAAPRAGLDDLGVGPDTTAVPAAGASEADAPGVRDSQDTPALDIDGLQFTYPGAAEPVLRGVTLRLEPGAFCLLVGGTGSGKSTLLSLIKHEIAPAGERCGNISVLGHPVEQLDAEASARTVGYVFQNPDNQIVCESVWHELAFGLENLGTPTGEMRRRIAETSYFFGIDDWFRDETDTLSGGRKQLLALAATLVMRPRVLLLDEPTAQLDPIAAKNFLHALFRVNRELGCTVVVATHDPRAMVDYATCAVRLVEGRLQDVPDMDELRRRPALLDGRTCELATAQVSSASAPAPAVQVRGAWFRYDRAGAWILRGLDIAARPGRIHALVGGNGCGKSTLLSVIAGAVKLRRGRVERAGGSHVLLPQDPRALFAQETAWDELIEWSGRAGYGADEVRALMERLGLSGCAELHPYDLSGGQQQLLACAKLLLTHPSLLLLDEPTKGLDLPSRRAVARLLKEVCAQGATVVLASHDLDFVAQVADDVFMMFDGEIACTDTSEEFFRGNVYYRP